MMEKMMSQSMQGGSEEMEQTSPLDGLIGQIDSYIADPSLVTPETLTDLKNQLVDLKGAMEGDEREGMGEQTNDMASKMGGY